MLGIQDLPGPPEHVRRGPRGGIGSLADRLAQRIDHPPVSAAGTGTALIGNPSFIRGTQQSQQIGPNPGISMRVRVTLTRWQTTLHLMERATSVYILNIISTDPAWVPSGDLADGALLVFRQHVAGADDVTAEFLDGIQFVDQGENFESVSCPRCGELLDDGWWAERMDDSWSPDLNAFADLQVVTPCCGTNSSLNDLDYEWPAGFASFRLQARNPSRGGFLPDAELEEIAAALGSPLRQVYAHY